MKKFIYLMTLMALSFEALSSTQIGRVVKLIGNVEIKRSNDSLFLKSGDSIQEGDRLESGARSFAKILMNDDTVFQIGPKSIFAFEKFKMKTKNERTATYSLVKGKLRSLFTKKAPTKSLHIKTPTASMGIRGTEIVTDVFNFKGEVKTDIALLEGKLEIIPKGKKAFFIKPGEVFATRRSKMNKDSKRVPASFNRVNKIPRKIFKKLTSPAQKGGEIFLKETPEIKAMKPLISKRKVVKVKGRGLASVNKNKEKLKTKKVRKVAIKELIKGQKLHKKGYLKGRDLASESVKKAHRKKKLFDLKKRLVEPKQPTATGETVIPGRNNGKYNIKKDKVE